jgi:hypothetical protein
MDIERAVDWGKAEKVEKKDRREFAVWNWKRRIYLGILAGSARFKSITRAVSEGRIDFFTGTSTYSSTTEWP